MTNNFESKLDPLSSIGNRYSRSNEINEILENGITPARAYQLLLEDIRASELAVKETLSNIGVQTIPTNAFDALVSMHNQLGDITYAYVNKEKIDLLGLFKNAEWSRAASFIAKDERDRQRRLKEAMIMATNSYPPEVSEALLINTAYEKTNELIEKGQLNQQTLEPPTKQQKIAATSSYFKHTGKMPSFADSETILNVINPESITKIQKNWGY